MLRFLTFRFLSLAATLAGVAIVVFAVLEVLPGDPAATMLGVSATPETIAALRGEFGLDRPAPLRLVSWIFGIFRGDLGISYSYRVPVSSLLGERVGVTLPLALLAVFMAAAIGIPFGALAASRAHTRLDAGLMVVAQLGLAVPNFWFGILFVLLFAITLGWLPAGGFPGWSAGITPALASLLLPAASLALPFAAVLARVTRSAMLEVLAEDFIRTARAKGLTRRRTIIRHGLRNALIPVITILGLQISFLLTGSIVVENVFALPGLGRLLIQAIGGHDLILVKNLVLVFAGSVIVVNAIVDIAYGFADPRLRAQQR